MSHPIHDSSAAVWTVILGPGLTTGVFPDERDDDERDLALAAALEHAYALGGHLRTVVVEPESPRRGAPRASGGADGEAPRMPAAANRRPAKILRGSTTSSALNLLSALSYVHSCSRSAIVFVIDLDVHRGELPSPLVSTAVIDQAATWQRLVVVGSPLSDEGSESLAGAQRAERGWIVPGEQAGFLGPVVQLHPTGQRPRQTERLGERRGDSLAYSGLVGGTLFAWARVFTSLRRQGTPDLFRDVLIPGFDNLLVARSPRPASVWPSLACDPLEHALGGSLNGIATVWHSITPTFAEPVWPEPIARSA
jgi:hypothetical protein